MADVISSEVIPGLYAVSEEVVAEIRIGSWKFQKLADGSVFASDWRGSEVDERMVGYFLLSPSESTQLVGLLKAKV